jgi:hypothetical protein
MAVLNLMKNKNSLEAERNAKLEVNTQVVVQCVSMFGRKREQLTHSRSP